GAGSPSPAVPGPTARPSGSTAPCCPSSLTPNPGCPTTNDSPPSTPGSIATTLDAPTPLSVADPQPPDSPPNCQQPPGSVQLTRGGAPPGHDAQDVAARHDAHRAPVLDDRHGPDPRVEHRRDHLGEVGVGPEADRVAGHHLAHRRFRPGVGLPAG